MAEMELRFFSSTFEPSGSVGVFAQRDVHVAAELAFFHVGIGDAALLEDHLQRAEIGEGFLAGFEVRLGDDLHERRAGAVEVDERGVAEVGGFGDVLFEVDAVEADDFVGIGDVFPVRPSG